jgi:nicotinamidase-related amidase
MLIDGNRSWFVMIDVQERLCPVMNDPRRVIVNCQRLLKGAALLDVPVLATEQYPRGLGPTMADLRPLLAEGAVIEKTCFSAAAEPAVIERLRGMPRPQVVVAGIEAHVCVAQTALGLSDQGFAVAVVGDACSSRHPPDEAAALARLAAAGIAVVTTEMVLFEWLGRADHPCFKTVQQTLIR